MHTTGTATATTSTTILKTTTRIWRLINAMLICNMLCCSKCEAIINWHDVKPMYLISMYPPPDDMLPMNQTNAMPPIEPVVLNLETIPLQDDMQPNDGRMAMNRIFGGNIGKPHCFPYQVGLLLQRPKGLYWCGGSLISDEFVLTAAHCVDMAKRALLFLGAHEIKNAKEAGQVRIMVNDTNFKIFPTWNPRRLKDDIALVRLPKRIEFTNRIQPIHLPKRSYEYRHFKNKLAIASGWGRYATGLHAISNVLRYVKLQIIDGRTCKRTFPHSYRSTNVCTSGRHTRSTCNGDSGGPLVLQRRQSKKRVLVGITSFGSIFGCDRGYPAAFTKVASYLDWISDEAGVDLSQESSHAVLFKDLLHDYQLSKAEIESETATELKMKTKSTTNSKRKTKAKKKPKHATSSALHAMQEYPDAKPLHANTFANSMQFEAFL